MNSFISRVVRRIRRKMSGLASAARSRAISPQAMTPTPDGNIGLTLSRQSADALSKIDGIYNVLVEGAGTRILLEELGDSAVLELKKKASEISRTGEFEDSFEKRIVNDQNVAVYSTVIYANAIRRGSDKPPSPSRLQDWMDNVADFAGESEAEKERISFAIYFSLKNKVNLNKTGRSDITRLPPTGERRYDYVNEALNELYTDIGSAGYALREGMRT